ncbi:GTP-binding protein 1 [Wallemia mellicola]|uniref:GTP-binding protein 1 n=1 Tax=Wallemia mellicola TaxID=1708541 RepID=A0A4T0LLI5_9BASI|nr:hypothetical protein E3Q24_02959 [Wallemia mellicola]TIB83029.1 GTP-binding protein 1 [Wallemia mellicola]TIB85732.1 GTP-binding protein 1 [Wallemia mellicola]TIC15603.1 GTP-binding protein 1 [Wallemia mellicola]TIC25236.1 GTP-binding protein 1 [Wallemia mellicola]
MRSSEISSEPELPIEISIAFACAAKLSSMDVLERAPPNQRKFWEIECNDWLERVSKVLKVEYESLPPEPTHDAIKSLGMTIPVETHNTVVPSFVMASLSKHNEDLPEYTAISRACMRNMLSILNIDLQLLRTAECQTATTIWITVKDSLNDDSEKARVQRKDRQKWIRWAATGSGIVIGGVVLGLTGGLAAPALAPLFAALPALGFFATGGGAIAIGVMFGLTGGGLSGYRVAKRTAGISEFKFVPIKNEVLFDGGANTSSTPTSRIDPEFKPTYDVLKKPSTPSTPSTPSSPSTPTGKTKPPVPPKPPTIKAKSQAEEKINNEKNAEESSFSFKKVGNSFEQFGSKTWMGMRKFGDTVSNGVANININNKTEKEKEAEKATENTVTAPSMTATICTTGLLLNSPEECVNVWREALGDIANAENDQRDIYALTTDPAYFLDAGKQINGWVIDKILNMAGTKILGATALGAFMAATAVPMALIGATGMVIDNAWQGAVDRAKKAGDILSDVIRDKVHGKRPLALIGHSIGALMLVKALLNLPAPDTPIISTLTLIALPASLNKHTFGTYFYNIYDFIQTVKMAQLTEFRREIDSIHEKAIRAQREAGHAKYLETALSHSKQQAKAAKSLAHKPLEAEIDKLSLDKDISGNLVNVNATNVVELLLSNDPPIDSIGLYVEDCIRSARGEYVASLGNATDGFQSDILTFEQVLVILKQLKKACKSVDCGLGVLYQRVTEDEKEAFVKIIIRRLPTSAELFQEVRLAVCGNVDAGKSTLLGILSRGGLDDGRGKMRVNLFRHKHEIESGRTSSVGLEIMGFDHEGNEVQSATQKHGWDEICSRSSKIVSFIDLAGHERYLKTTIFGMTGTQPDYATLIVGANAGLIGMSKEHLAISLALDVPVFICVTKIDMAPPNVLEQTLKQLTKILKSPGCRKTPVFIRSKEEAAELSSTFVRDRVAPIFLISSVTGSGIPHLKTFLNVIPPASAGPDIIEQPLEFMINDVYSVPYAGTVVSGIVNTGSIRLNDTVMVGPDSLGNFITTSVKSMQRKRANVNIAEAGQSVSLALKRVRRTAVRKGQVVIAKTEPPPKASWRFVGNILILYHSTTIKPSYQAMAHIGSIRQTVKVVGLNNDNNLLRTGDRASVTFEFVKNPEYIKEGMQLLFREGRTKGLGVIAQVVD